MSEAVKGEVVTTKEKAASAKETIELKPEHKSIAFGLRSRIQNIAKDIIEIGTELAKVVDSIKETKGTGNGYVTAFYKEVGISSRSAQRYMQIAKNEKVLEMTEEDREGKTFTDLYMLCKKPGEQKNFSEPVKAAQGFYSRYKNKPDELEEIIKELQKLLAKSKEESSDTESSNEETK